MIHVWDHFDYSGDAARMEAEIRRLSQYPDHDVTGYREFIALSERIFAKGFTELASVPFLHVTDMLKIAPDLSDAELRDVAEAVRAAPGVDGVIVSNTTIQRPSSLTDGTSTFPVVFARN